MATVQLRRLDNARRRTKPSELCEKVSAAVNPEHSPLPDCEFFCPPGGTYSVPDVCTPPPLHLASNSHPPACDLRRARGGILGNFSLASYTVDRGAFLR